MSEQEREGGRERGRKSQGEWEEGREYDVKQKVIKIFTIITAN